MSWGRGGLENPSSFDGPLVLYNQQVIFSLLTDLFLCVYKAETAGAESAERSTRVCVFPSHITRSVGNETDAALVTLHEAKPSSPAWPPERNDKNPADVEDYRKCRM